VIGRAAIHTVLVGGETVVEHGRHRRRSEIAARYARAMADVAAA
jgi:hypothetical protein